MLDGATGIFLKPALELHRNCNVDRETSERRTCSSVPESRNDTISLEAKTPDGMDIHAKDSTASTGLCKESDLGVPLLSNRSQHAVEKNGQSYSDATARSMAADLGKSLGKFFTAFSKDMLIDMPLATAEGLRSMPRLWVDDVKEYYQVIDLQSGASVAGKTFVRSMYDGWDCITKGREAEGVIGVVKGAGSLVCGTAGATLGLVFRPLDGLTRSLGAWAHSAVAKRVAEARLEEGRWQARRLSVQQWLRVVDIYHESRRRPS